MSPPGHCNAHIVGRVLFDRMKSYRCTFNFAGGRTTIDVVAVDAVTALSEAKLTVQDHPETIEIWDEAGLILGQTPAPSRRSTTYKD